MSGEKLCKCKQLHLKGLTTWIDLRSWPFWSPITHEDFHVFAPLLDFVHAHLHYLNPLQNIKVSNLYVVDVSGICLHWAVKGTIRTRIEFYVEDQLD